MIFAKNNDALSYRGICPDLDLALEHITPEFLATVGERRVELSPGRVWCTRFTYETIPEEEGFFEAHKDFLDIHLMLAGRERVLLAPPSQLEMFRCEPDNDFYAYRGQSWHQVVLSPGDFLVVFPDDAHDIKLRLDRPETVTKAVFKVKIK